LASRTHTAQPELLTGLQDGSISLPTMPGTSFFNQLLTNVKEGFLADPMYGGNKNMAGWKLVGFPGAQGDYRQAIRMHNQDLNLQPVSINQAKAKPAAVRTPVAVPAPCAPVTVPLDPCAPVTVPCDPCAPSTPVTVYRKGC
ncbi:MAG: gluconate 2-dehydrogenase subunit 3 family protein, partial [Planctomycetaceae bacterium]|nr:gluconate 2-dehydrogenase subunit 3 family protein [Planctomycetaceae bacterium]